MNSLPFFPCSFVCPRQEEKERERERDGLLTDESPGPYRPVSPSQEEGPQAHPPPLDWSQVSLSVRLRFFNVWALENAVAIGCTITACATSLVHHRVRACFPHDHELGRGPARDGASLLICLIMRHGLAPSIPTHWEATARSRSHASSSSSFIIIMSCHTRGVHRHDLYDLYDLYDLSYPHVLPWLRGP